MRFLRFLPFAVPLAYLLVIFAVQPAKRQIAPGGSAPGYPLSGQYARLITDDNDTSAWVLRAENAARGRKAGRPDEPLEWPKERYEGMILDHDEFFGPQYASAKPLSGRYFLEYPPAALYFFRLGLIGSGRPTNDELVNHALLDGHQFHIGCHVPKNATEEKLYGAFRHAQEVYAVILLAVLFGTMVLVHNGVGVNGTAKGAAWLLVLPGTLYFTPSRFDILPAALVLASIAATDRKRPLLGAVCLGLGAALKTYPVILAPLVLRYAARTWGQAVAWCVAFGLVPLAFAASLAYTDGIEAITGPLAFQAKRTPHPEWVFYNRIFPTGFAFGDLSGQLFRAVPMLLLVGFLSRRRAEDAEVLIRRCAVAVILFVSLQVIFSPQWWIWIATLLVPLTGRRRWLVGAVAFGEVLTYATFPLLFDVLAFRQEHLPVCDSLREASVWVRIALWGGVLVALALEEKAARTAVTSDPSSAPVPSSVPAVCPRAV